MLSQERIDQLAKIIWDYHHLNQELTKGDCILVLCSYDLRVAEYAAQLYLDGYAPLIVFSGGMAHQDDLLRTNWDKPEAEMFAQTAHELGVPAEDIIIEPEAKNTGQNVIFSRKILEERGMHIEKMILVQKPSMERRTLATFKKYWPEMDAVVTSPDIPFEDYPTEHILKNDFINVMLGDLQRIQLYPEKGFQIPQHIPKEVLDASEELIQNGFDKHLIA